MNVFVNSTEQEELGQYFFCKKVFKVFPFVALATRILRGIRISEKKGDHPRIIPMNFSEVVKRCYLQ